MSRWLIVATILSGCATSWTEGYQTDSSTPSTAYVCVDLPRQHQAQAFAAISMWGRAIERWRVLEPIAGRDKACSYWIEEGPPSEMWPTAIAYAACLGCNRITMVLGRYEQDVFGLTLHEMGHVLGAQHVPGTLMNPAYDSKFARCPDATTVAQVAAWNRLNLAQLRYCY